MHKKGKMPVLLSIFLLLITVSVLHAGETGKIAGVAKDAKTGDVLPGANILITALWEDGKEVPLSKTIGAATDMDGYFYIINLRPGKYSVTASFIGYGKVKKTEVDVYVDKTTQLDFNLEQEEYQSEEVVVTEYRSPKVESDRTSTKQVFSTSEIEEIAGINDVADILELQADVIDNHFRGGREGESQYLFGGASINNPISANRSFSPMVTGIQQVEVFTSGFSAEYGNAQSGVVNMVPKEGGDKWITKFAYSQELPYFETWGGNPFTTDYMPLWNLLSNAEEWLNNQDPQLSSGDPMFKDYLGFWPSGYEPTFDDSLRLASFAMRDWMQVVRDIGLEYNEIPTSRIDFSTGGPVARGIKVFVAARQEDKNPIIPTPLPNRSRQWLSNLTANINDKDKLTLSFSYNEKFNNDVDDDPQIWSDRIFQVPKENQTSKLYGLDYNNILSQSTFFDLSFKVLNTFEETRVEYLDPDKYRNNGANGERIGGVSINYVGRYRNTPFGTANNMELKRGNESSTTYSFIGSITSQLNKGNMVKTGFQLFSYALNGYREENIKSEGERELLDFKAYPYEGALYIQDKMEFEGMIANIGLRFEFYDFNTNYFSDTFNPRRGGETSRTEIVTHFAPRLGVSFPVSENSVFHINYGSFVQRPSFNRIYYTTWVSDTEFNRMGNPELKPERTNSYDVGILQSLPLGFTLDVSAYYKDVKDLIHEAIYFSNNGNYHIKYGNLDYANIKGFHVNLEQLGKNWKAYINYNYQVATGKASGPGSQNIIEVYENPALQKDRDPEDILMDYDRSHRLVANLSYRWKNKEGPEIFGFRPFENMSISATFRIQTGQPYTDDEQYLGVVYNKRMPTEYNLKVRLQKGFEIGGIDYMFYIEGFNLLNFKVYDQDVFDYTNDLRLLDRYKNGERESLIWYDYKAGSGTEDDYMNRYRYSMEQIIYRNTPRYFRLGVELKL
ncbi:MAG: TonB-dependent receptor [Bacteroidetes bacterium]|nr:TonB-dependent receptor [Bacteroidota bacterium]